MKTKIEQQLKHNDCGISAAKIIYNLHNIEVNRNYIEENIQLSSGGSSLTEIKDFFDKEYFETTLNLIDANSAKFNSRQIEEFLPCILPIKNNQRPHYVVIKGISGKKVQILDPGKGESYKWTFSELMNNALMATANYEWVNNRQIIAKIISDELAEYEMQPENVDMLDQAEVMNKLTYFTYVKENFGFKHHDAEKAFLTDLIFNQQINTLPKQFRSLKLQQDKLRIQAPVVLTIKKNKETNYSAVNPAPEVKNINPYRRLVKELKQHHNLWYIYITTAIFAALLTQLAVFSNQILIDEVLPDFDMNLLVVFAIGLAVFKLFDLVLSFFKDFIAIHLANILDNFFLTSFIDKLNSFPIRYIQSYSRGDLTERIKDSLKLKSFFIRFFTSIIIDIFVCIYAVTILLVIDWQITMIVVSILILFVIWFKIVTPYIRDNEKKRFIEKSNLFSSLFENIDGLQVIKSLGLENIFRNRLSPRINSILGIQKRVRYVSLVNSLVIDVIIISAGILIIVLLSSRAIHSENISIGQIITFIALSHEIFSSVSGILNENLDLQENQIILSRYFDFGKNEDKKQVVLSQSKIKNFRIDTISFQNISFFYNPDKPVFSDLNTTITKGDKIRLEGNNGTGKSTFCKVLSLLYPQNSGSILINGEKQVFYNETSLRKKILLVSNEDILFNDTLGYNITFNNNSDTLVILNLAKEIGLYNFISDKDEGLEYVISEQGRNLSTGQRKKILLMRAFLSDAELLIFDETLSGIDSESKEKIEAYINRQRDRSFIIISHEPLMHINFNKNILLQDGKIQQLHDQVV
jgi:subfamily B ATP-binding cassette protein HlyB/CyaB